MRNEVVGSNFIRIFFPLRKRISCHVENGQEIYIIGNNFYQQILTLKVRGTQRQFSENYLFGRRFEV